MEKETNQEKILEERNEFSQTDIQQKAKQNAKQNAQRSSNSYIEQIKQAIITKPTNPKKNSKSNNSDMNFQSKQFKRYSFTRAGKTKRA